MDTIKLQPIPYQGSKRNIAQQIMEYYTGHPVRLIEPFAGSAAMTLYIAHHGIADKFIINDSSEPLMALWEKIINTPEDCAAQYEKIWQKQVKQPEEYYLKIRSDFNRDHDPIKFLFLMARCAKNAIRFNSRGEFNQSADKRRLGRHPKEMQKHILSTSSLLRGRTQLMNGDYEAVLAAANPDDLVYMDPPYQGTSTGRNPRYHQGLDLQRFIENLEKLNERHISYLLSFDGQLGEKKYGEPLPAFLKLRHVPIHAGRSSQATLNGKKEMTIESLYISPNVAPAVSRRLFPVAV